MRLILPIALAVAAIGLFVVYTDPTYQASKQLQGKLAAYDDALTKSQELRSVRDQLLSKRNTFSADDVQKLQDMLPDNVDNIRLIIDINNIASHHSLTLQQVSLGEVSKSRTAAQANAVGNSGDPIGSVEVGFSITTDYDSMLAFLQDLEHSLRLIDVEKLNFTVAPLTPTTYAFTIRTYWLH